MLSILLRRKWIVMTTCVLVIGFFAVRAYLEEPYYTASSLVLIAVDTPRAGLSGESEEGEPFARGDRSLDTELIVLRNSQVLARRVAERLIETQVLPATEHLIPLLVSSDGSFREIEAVESRVKRSVQFTRENKDADVIRITAHSSDPDEAVLLADLYLDEYVAHSQRANRARLASSRIFLEQQAENRSRDLKDIEERVQAFQSRHGTVSLDDESISLVSRLAQAEVQRDEAQLALRTREATLSLLEEQLGSISPERLSERMGSATEGEISALQARIAELELSRKDIQLQGRALTAADSSQLTQIEERIRQMRNDVNQLSRSYIDEVMAAGGLGATEGVRRVEELQRQIAEARIETAGLGTRLAVLDDRIAQYEGQLRAIPHQAMELAQLQRDRSYEEQMYRAVVQNLQETRFQEASQLGYASRVSSAAGSAQSSGPGPRRALMLGTMLGLLLGGTLAVARDRLDRRIYEPETLKSAGHSLVGLVPDLKQVEVSQRRVKELTAPGKESTSSELVPYTDSLSAAADAYRNVRTNILYSRHDRVIRTLMVTSPGMGDGKSLTAANLAIVMAQSGRRTLLIDADLHRPRLHTLFGIDQSPGLSRLFQQGLAGGLPVQPTAIEHLYLVPAGHPASCSRELLGYDELRELFRVARGGYDTIIVDTPPVHATADAALFSTQCDGTILVARAGLTTEDEVEKAVEALTEVGGRVIGVLLNGFNVSMAYGYKLRYRHYAQYGPYDRYGSTASASRPRL